MRFFVLAIGLGGLLPVASMAQPSLGGAVGLEQLAQLPPGVANPVPQRNPIERVAPRPPVRLQPSIEGPPLVPQTGPGAATEVRVAAVRVTGNAALDSAALAPATAGLAGATMPLARIEEARLAILRTYRDAGYPFAAISAGVTPRPDGQVDLAFAVTEGFIAEVTLDGDPDAIGPAGTQVLRFLNRLIGQRPVTAAALERALLLASDIPGLRVSGTLRPLPNEPGALQLVAQVERRVVSGYANIDNRGYRYAGPWQGLLVAGVNSLTEFGERTELSLFGVPDSAQWFVQGSVESFIGGSGLRVRLYGGTGETRPTGPLRQIGYYGSTQLGGVSASYPIIRSRPVNLFAAGSFDMFDGVVESGTSGRSRASRDQIRTLRFGLDGQLLDDWIAALPAATNLASVRLHQGITSLGATSNGDLLSGRSGAEDFGFFKVSGELQRTQPLFYPAANQMISIQGLVAGQWTDAILPQAEKFYLGGNRLGRGFYSGQVTGDKAWAYSLELQYDVNLDMPFDLPSGSSRLAPQFYLFRDFGRAIQNRPDDLDSRLSSWGGGVRLVISEALQFDLEGVHRETRRPQGTAADPLSATAVIFRTLVRF